MYVCVFGCVGVCVGLCVRVHVCGHEHVFLCVCGSICVFLHNNSKVIDTGT